MSDNEWKKEHRVYALAMIILIILLILLTNTICIGGIYWIIVSDTLGELASAIVLFLIGMISVSGALALCRAIIKSGFYKP